MTQPDIKQLDITGAMHVDIEIDANRKVLYVHIDGVTALRVCRINQFGDLQTHNGLKTTFCPLVKDRPAQLGKLGK